MEPITPENIHELTPGEWIWDNETISRRDHKRQIGDDRVTEPIGFRQIHILDADENRYWMQPFMLSTIDSRDSHVWEHLEPNRFYKFKKEKEDRQEISIDKSVQGHMGLFRYNIRDRGDLAVGVVLARDIDEAKATLQNAFRLDSISDDDVIDVIFSSHGICEIYYGT
jgi:hypothetical protein